MSVFPQCAWTNRGHLILIKVKVARAINVKTTFDSQSISFSCFSNDRKGVEFAFNFKVFYFWTFTLLSRIFILFYYRL